MLIFLSIVWESIRSQSIRSHLHHIYGYQVIQSVQKCRKWRSFNFWKIILTFYFNQNKKAYDIPAFHAGYFWGYALQSVERSEVSKIIMFQLFASSSSYSCKCSYSCCLKIVPCIKRMEEVGFGVKWRIYLKDSRGCNNKYRLAKTLFKNPFLTACCSF